MRVVRDGAPPRRRGALPPGAHRTPRRDPRDRAAPCRVGQRAAAPYASTALTLHRHGRASLHGSVSRRASGGPPRTRGCGGGRCAPERRAGGL